MIDEEETITRAVASAEVRDLVEFNDLSGRMVYADVKPIVSSEDGVITDVLHSGDTIERGTVLYALNDSPTAAFYGTFPLYRKLMRSCGEDVIVLKKNLSALGYHSFEEDDGTMIDTGFVVDNVFDDSTTEAVKRWQKDQEPRNPESFHRQMSSCSTAPQKSQMYRPMLGSGSTSAPASWI